MFEATVLYEVSRAPAGHGKLKLTLVGSGDAEALKSGGLASLRRRRLMRIAGEALEQGCPISYKDLSNLLFTSISTLKRDIQMIERLGEGVPLRGRYRFKGALTEIK